MILQADASDLFWGSVLIEEYEKEKKYCCDHASRQFKESENIITQSIKRFFMSNMGFKSSSIISEDIIF